MDAWLGGIWYDSGEAYADGDASAQHCSPIGKTRNAAAGPFSYLPTSASAWTIDPNGGATLSGTDPLLTRNL